MSFTNETDKQKYYIEKCRELIAAKEQKLGRKLTACVVTFGCQMNFKDSEKLMGILSQIGYQEINVNAESYLAFLTTSRVSSKSSSVSPGKPTIISVEIPMSGIAALNLSTKVRYCSLS